MTTSIFSNFYVILVEPEYEGNIGFVARHMKVFGFRNLVLINPPKISEEARRRAMHGLDILENAIILDNIEDAINMVDYAVGTSAVTHRTGKRHLRTYIEVREFAEKIKKIDGKIGLFFGRESSGLTDEELSKMDIMVHIPANPEYPVLNLSHAVTIVLYELFRAKKPRGKRKKMTREAKKVLYEKAFELIEMVIPEYRKTPTKLAFKRVIERSMPSEWEYHRIIGIFAEAVRIIKECKGNKNKR